MSRERKPAGDHRRASMALAQLGWLAGHPDDGGWRSLAEDRVQPLDGAAIARARRTARTVLREHPEELARLVGDVDAWWAIVDAKLAWMSRVLAGAPDGLDLLPLLPSRLASTIRALRTSPIARAADAAAIAFAGVAELAPILDWLAAHRALELPWRTLLALARLAATGDRGKARAIRERGVEALIVLAALDAPDGAAALQASVTAENALRKQNTKARLVDPQRSAARVLPWIARLAIRDPEHRQRVLAIAAEARLAEALAPWQAWERDHQPLLARALELAGVTFGSTLERGTAEAKLLVRFERARRAAPVEVPLEKILAELDLLGGDPIHAPAIARLLAVVPAEWGAAAPARLLLETARTAAIAPQWHPAWVWDALAAALAAGAPVELIGPWRAVLERTPMLYLEHDLAEYLPRRPAIERAIRVLTALARTGPLVNSDLTRTGVWLAAGLDEALVPEIILATRAQEGWLLLELARAILAISERTVEAITELANQLLEVSADWIHDTTQAMCVAIEHVAASGAGWLVRAAIEAKQAAILVTIGRLLAPLPRTQRPRLVIDAPAPWIARYPAALAPALQRLVAVDPEAERTAAKRLADDLPDPVALRGEIEALRARLDRPGAAKRLANLEARLAKPTLPSPARLANLAAKLERTACELGLARLARTVTASASDRVVRAFGLAALPAWASEPKTIVLLVALIALGERDRQLAGRLIRARGGDRPWDLRDDPVNQRFLAELRAAGVDPAPWLDDRPHALPDGLTLELTGDPIEVFAMGGHFGTCLSPGATNFFSVVANAADVNKRVIYVRREGRVIGRCLLALSEQFAILTFHVYAHEQITAVEEHIRTFVLGLATRMNTTLAPAGRVRTLLADDWYDDGPRDLVGRFRGLDAAGLDLAHVDPAAVVGVLRAALGRELDDVTLPIVLAHPGIRERPALILPLAPHVLASRAPQVRIAAAELAFAAGDRTLADRLLGDHAGAIRLGDHAWQHGPLIAELRPAYTLRRLRETREREIRDWDDEPSDRCGVAAIALEALHRPKQALAMYELALRDRWIDPSLGQRARRLRARLRS